MVEDLNAVLTKPVTEKEPKTPEDMSERADETLTSPVDKEADLVELQKKVVADKKMTGFKLEQTKGEVEKMRAEQEKQAKNKEFVTAAVKIMIEDLKTKAGFKPNESSTDFAARMKEENSHFFSRLKNTFSASGEIFQKIKALEYKQAGVTGQESIEMLKTEATFCSRNVDKEIASAYQELFPDGNYKQRMKDEYQQVKGRIDGGGGVSNNSWQG